MSMSSLSFANRRRTLTTNAWPTQRQQLFMRKQNSFIETGSNNHANILHKGRGILTRGLSVGRSYDGVRNKLNVNTTNATTNLRYTAGNPVYLQRQQTFEQDFKYKNGLKPREPPFVKNSRVTSTSTTRLNYTSCTQRGGINCLETNAGKQKNIVTWSSHTCLRKSIDDNDDADFNQRKKPLSLSIEGAAEHKFRDTRKASLTTTSTTTNALQHQQQRICPSSKGEVNKINLNIVLPQASKTSVDNETTVSDIESSLDSGVDTDTNSSRPLKPKASINNKTQVTTSSSTTNSTTTTQSAVYRRAQFRGSRIDTAATTTTATTTTITTNATASIPIPTHSTPPTTVVITTPTPLPTPPSTVNFSASPSLTVQRRPPLVRAMSAPVRPLDDNSKGVFAGAANKRKPRRRRIIARNISCEKTTECGFLDKDNLLSATDILNGKKVLARSRSTVACDVITLVSLMSSEGSDSEREDTLTKTTTSTPTSTSTKSESTPTRRAPSLRKTGKSVSFQENYPPNFQLASKEYSHMIRRGSIAPLAARIRTNRPPTAPPVSIFLSMTTNAESNKERDLNVDSNRGMDNEKRTPMGEKADNKDQIAKQTSGSGTDSNTDYNFPDYVRSIKERECWKLYQKMCNKGVNVSYDTILRGMLTPTEFRQIQKQRELEEAKARELAEAENEGENVKPPAQTAIERLSEALLKK